MKNRKLFDKLGDFVLGKGFYIVLFLCVATIGMTGYYLIRNVDLPAQPAGSSTPVVLPDSEAEGPDPVGSLPLEQEPAQSTAKPQPVEVPEPDKQVPTQPAEQHPPQEGGQKSDRPAAAVYTWPVKGEVLRDFSVEILSLDPTLGDWRTHDGVDIASALGTKVLAMSAGTVERVYEDGLMGTTVVIDHGEGLKSTYRNLEEVAAVEPEQAVETGTVIGKVGQTAIGESGLASHLHLEVSLNGKPVDPLDYLPKMG